MRELLLIYDPQAILRRWNIRCLHVTHPFPLVIRWVVIYLPITTPPVEQIVFAVRQMISTAFNFLPSARHLLLEYILWISRGKSWHPFGINCEILGADGLRWIIRPFNIFGVVFSKFISTIWRREPLLRFAPYGTGIGISSHSIKPHSAWNVFPFRVGSGIRVAVACIEYDETCITYLERGLQRGHSHSITSLQDFWCAPFTRLIDLNLSFHFGVLGFWGHM